MATKQGRGARDERDGREDRGIEELGEGEALVAVEDMNALTAITKGEVDIQVATAKRYPRSIQAFLKGALSQVTADEDTAASCFYTLPRKKKATGPDGRSVDVPITGPSVRLAEIVASEWGNLRAETRIIDEGAVFVIAQGTAWDMERNVLIRSEVRRRITDRNGQRYSDDMVATTANAASSIALRNAVFRVVPRSYVNKLDAAARRVAVGDEKTLDFRRQAALNWWAKAGVPEARVCAALGVAGAADIDLPKLEELTGMRTALQEKRSTIDELFPAEAPPAGGIVNVRKPKPPATAEEKAANPGMDPKTGVMPDKAASPAPAASKEVAKEEAPAVTEPPPARGEFD